MMTKPTRRSILRSSLALAAAGTIARPYISNAAAKTAVYWQVQGFAQEEDIAFKKIIAEYEKQSGNTIDYTIVPYAPHRQKVVSAITSGDVPDIFPANPSEVVSLFAWQDKLLDVSDVVETQKAHYMEAALLSAQAYNSVTKKRSFYGVPHTSSTLPHHVWKSLVEKAGAKIDDVPKTWDAFYNFFGEVHKKLKAQGLRNVYGLGIQITTNGVDPNNTFHYWLAAYGGKDIVTKDGKLHLDDPQIKQAAIKALANPTKYYKDGFVPPGAVNWNDADDNNAFHAKQIVMDLDGTISTEVAIIKNKEDYDDIVTMGLPLNEQGQKTAAQTTPVNLLVPKGAKNVEVAKEFLKFYIQPEIVNEQLKTGLGRNCPCMPSIVKNDPWWFADPHRKAYTTECLIDPTYPAYWAFSPAYAEVQNTHVWGEAWLEIIQKGTAPEAAFDKAAKRIEDIFAKYPMAQS